ncbi:uncharacterized protein LOC128721193 [Anopheles nili]|uniref:uncharacterized protein LOC128721193 n=1 Tax=Anopheles nili TaxID=185578 RepID=UPI00237C12A6|nr:uncharacterized protein LOC128721193 [Anopheles nili]XP_053670895.1 uncharacterized protein LOC128721193 [Anopheles nili]
MDNWKCKACGCFPNGEVFQCAAKDHIWCISCWQARDKVLCVCGAKMLKERKANPIEGLLDSAMTCCRYAANGCTWMFPPSKMAAHVGECRYRPYGCIADGLNVIKCEWHGLQKDIEDHLKKEHRNLGNVFRFREVTSLVFKEQVSLGGLKLIDAFSKTFLLHFFSNADSKKLFFLLVYFGRHEEASQYCFELDIRAGPFSLQPAKETSERSEEASGDTSSSGFLPSVRFVERCYCDAENLTELLDQERCVMLTHQQVKKYLHKDKLYFSFKVRKADGGNRDRKTSKTGSVEEAPVVKSAQTNAKPRPAPFVFPKKGKAETNTKRSPTSSNSSSGSSANNSSSSSSRSSSSSTSSSSSSSSSNKNISNQPSRSPSSASTVALGMSYVGNRGSESPQVIHSLSSINSMTGCHTTIAKPEHSPLMTPSINKHDMAINWPASHTTVSGFSYHTSIEYLRQGSFRSQQCYPPAECTTTASVCQKYTQPYKANDDRMFLLKHPTNCLYKPQPRWSAGSNHN